MAKTLRTKSARVDAARLYGSLLELAKIGAYRGPLLQSHGDRDTIIPLKFAKKLFDAANEPKRFILLRGHDHNDGRPADYYDKLREFLDARA